MRSPMKFVHAFFATLALFGKVKFRYVIDMKTLD